MKHLWQQLQKPFFVQAPMENVSDTVFRQILAAIGKPDVFFTEFTSVEGLCSDGRGRVIRKFQFTPHETPLVAQVWGNTPAFYKQVAHELVSMGFAGMDINMGCPDRSIVQKGACSGLMRNRALVSEIIHAAREGLAGRIPLSVKTRIGYSKIETEDWIGFLLSHKLDALTVHGRTVSEMSKVPAHWDEIAKAVHLRNKGGYETVVIGNGDITGRKDGLEKAQQSGVDGVMIGRGMFHNLWAFHPSKTVADFTAVEKMQVLIDHISLFMETWGDTKPFDVMKKFYKVYVSGLYDANEFRMQLMEASDAAETIAILKQRMEKEQHVSAGLESDGK
jgi:tRNA-dihydrouridine synthase